MTMLMEDSKKDSAGKNRKREAKKRWDVVNVVGRAGLGVVIVGSQHPALVPYLFQDSRQVPGTPRGLTQLPDSLRPYLSAKTFAKYISCQSSPSNSKKQLQALSSAPGSHAKAKVSPMAYCKEGSDP